MLVQLIRNIWRTPTLQSPIMIRAKKILCRVYDGPYTIWILLALGIVRALLFVLAYPPAHGADSQDYFLYAAQFEGLDAPIVFQLIYPLYPMLIYLTHYVLGSVYVLIGLQMAFSAVQGIMFYWGIRTYNPALAFIMALLVIFDAQTGVPYNFTSTEPLYMFLLNLAFAVFLVQVLRPSGARWQKGDIVLGILLALTLMTRPVGRYLIVPFGVLFLLATQSVRRTMILGAAYGAVLVALMIFNQSVFGHLQLNGGGDFMLNRPLIRSGLLTAENGPASTRLLAMKAQCLEGETDNQCYTRQMGEWRDVMALYSKAYREMLRERGRDFAGVVFDEFTRFLTISAQQYSGPVLPSDVQCEDMTAVAERNTQHYLEKDDMFYDVEGITYSSFYPIMYDIQSAMCPAWPKHDAALLLTDWLALRYRSLSRPHPYLWYGMLGSMVVFIPWARRQYLWMVLLAGAILANHAAISAIVLNVQPRYVVVTNPYKGVLLLVTVVIVGHMLLRGVDEFLLRRASGGAGESPDKAV